MQVENIQDEKFYVDIAIKESSRQLDIAEFIKISNFPIDKFIIDRFWNNIEKKIPIYLDNILLEWCGYKSELKKQKYFFLQTVKNNDIPILELKQDKYIEYYNQLSDDAKNSCNFKTPQELSEQKWSSSINHILITPLNFKRLVMMLKTSRGSQVRDYFLTLEILMKTYMSYQVEFQKHASEMLQRQNNELIMMNNELSRKLDEIAENSNILIEKQEELLEQFDEMKGENEIQGESIRKMSQKLGIATTERAVRTKNTRTHEKFILVELNDPQYEWKYSVIRAQKFTANKKLKSLKDVHSESKICIEIEYQPNSINLFNLIKEELKDKRKVINVKYNYINLEENYTHEEFLEDIRKIDRSKVNIPVQ